MTALSPAPEPDFTWMCRVRLAMKARDWIASSSMAPTELYSRTEQRSVAREKIRESCSAVAPAAPMPLQKEKLKTQEEMTDDR